MCQVQVALDKEGGGITPWSVPHARQGRGSRTRSCPHVRVIEETGRASERRRTYLRRTARRVRGFSVQCTRACTCFLGARRARARNWSVIEQTGEQQQEKIDTYHDVKAVKELDGLVNHGLDISLLAHARLECRGLDVGEALLDQRKRLLHHGQVDVNEEHVRAVLCEQARRLEADAAVHRKVEESWGGGGLSA